MVVYSLVVKRSAAREIDALPTDDRRRVIARIAALASNPRPHGAQKLTGEDKYRLRQGDYRVVYTIADEVVTVTVVRVAFHQGRFTSRDHPNRRSRVRSATARLAEADRRRRVPPSTGRRPPHPEDCR